MEYERMRPEEHAALINNIGNVVSKILTERARREGYDVTVTWRLREREGGERDDRKAAV